MQIAIPALRHRRAETGSSYPLAGKRVNSFVYPLLINTTTGFGRNGRDGVDLNMTRPHKRN
jgi:hypothetical protein